MTNYKEILRLHSLGINNTRIAESCGCARSTVISTVQRAQEKGIAWEDIRPWVNPKWPGSFIQPLAQFGKFCALDGFVFPENQAETVLTFKNLWRRHKIPSVV